MLFFDILRSLFYPLVNGKPIILVALQSSISLSIISNSNHMVWEEKNRSELAGVGLL